MKRLLTAAAALTIFFPTAISTAVAQSTTIPAVMGICTVVIEEQYNDKHDRDGQCIGAVEEFLLTVGAPSAAADPLIVELITELVELYRDDPECRIAWTELPQAIATAAAAVVDEEIAAEIRLIGEQIASCDFIATAATGAPAAPGAPGALGAPGGPGGPGLVPASPA
jgi:hypothetical protein